MNIACRALTHLVELLADPDLRTGLPDLARLTYLSLLTYREMHRRQ